MACGTSSCHLSLLHRQKKSILGTEDVTSPLEWVAELGHTDPPGSARQGGDPELPQSELSETAAFGVKPVRRGRRRAAIRWMLPSCWHCRDAEAVLEPQNSLSPQDHTELLRLNHSWDCAWCCQLLCLLWTSREKVKPSTTRALHTPHPRPPSLQHPGRAAAPAAEIQLGEGQAFTSG